MLTPGPSLHACLSPLHEHLARNIASPHAKLGQRPGTCAQVVPILRAGLVLLDQAATVLPNAATYHVGYVRDEATLEVRPAVWCGACPNTRREIPRFACLRCLSELPPPL